MRYKIEIKTEFSEEDQKESNILEILMEPVSDTYSDAEKIKESGLRVELMLAAFCMVDGRYDNCHESLNKAKEKALEVGFGLGAVYRCFGDLYASDPKENPYYNLEQAVESYTYSIELAGETDNREALGWSVLSRMSLAELLFEMGRYERALKECEYFLHRGAYFPKIEGLVQKIKDAMSEA